MAFCPLLLLLLLSVGCTEAVKVKISPYSTECINEVAAAGDLVSGSFVGSVEGGRRGDLFMYRTFFDLEVKAEDGLVLHQVRNRQDAKFEFVMPKEGRFSACIRNYGRHNTEVVYHTFIGHKPDHGKVTSDQLQPMRDSMRGVRTVLRQLMEEQTYQRQRDAMHLATNESTGRRAVIYSVIESGGLICVSLLQVLLLKRLFDGTVKPSQRNSSPRFGTPSWGV